MDPGLGWHILTGKQIFETWEVPRSDPFLFYPEHAPWVHDSWLGSLLLYGIFSLGGSSFLILLSALISWLSFYIQKIYLLTSPEAFSLRSAFIFSLWLLLCIFSSSPNWVVRPVVFSFFMCSLLILLYLKARKGDDVIKNTILFFLLFLIWGNLHGAWVAGYVWLCVVLFFESLILKKWAVFLAYLFFSFAGTLCNPYFIELHLSIYSLLTSDFYMNLNEEWLPPQIGDPAFFSFYLLSLSLILLLVLLRKKEQIPVYVGTVMLLLASLKSARSIYFFAISSMAIGVLILVPFYATLFQRRVSGEVNRLRGGMSEPGIIFCMLLAVLGCFLVPMALPPSFRNETLPLRVHEDIIHAISSHSSCGERIYSHPDWGGGLLFALLGKASAEATDTGGRVYKVFIDDRNQISSETKYQRFFDSLRNPEVFLGIDKEAKPDIVLVQDRYPLSGYLLLSPDWEQIAKAEMADYGLVRAFCRK